MNESSCDSLLVSLQLLGVYVRIESNHDRLASLKSRCAKIPCRPKHQLRDRIVLWSIIFQIDFCDFLTASHDQAVDSLEESEGFFSTESLLLRIDLGSCRYIVSRKKLLRACARRSSLTMIRPVNSRGHCRFLMSIAAKMLPDRGCVREWVK